MFADEETGATQQDSARESKKPSGRTTVDTTNRNSKSNSVRAANPQPQAAKKGFRAKMKGFFGSSG